MKNTISTSKIPVTSDSLNDFEVLKKIHPDGEVTSHHSFSENKIRTYQGTYFDAVSLAFSQLDSFVNMMTDSDYERIGFIFKALLRDAQLQLEDIEGALKKYIGEIKIERACHGEWPCMPGTVLEVSIESVNKEAAE